MKYFRSSFRTLSLICCGILAITAYGAPYNPSYSSTDNTSGKVPNGQEQEEIKQRMEIYPFELSNGSIQPNEVAGIRITPKSTFLFSYDSKCTSQQNDEKTAKLDNTQLFSQYEELQFVELSELKLTNEALENLQKFLPRKLKGLSISNCVMTKAEAPRLADIVKTHDQLSSLTFSFPQCSAKKSSMLLNALTSHGSMQFLNFTFGHINGEGAHIISELIKNSGNTLRSLTLAVGQIEDDQNNEAINTIVENIGSLTNLKSLELCFLQLPEDAAYRLFEALGHLKSLTSLRLYIGNFASYDQMNLFNNLEVCRNSIENMKLLESLDISLMKLPPSFMHLFAQAVASLPELKLLNISNNKLDEKAAEIFANSFKNTDKLEVLMANSCSMDGQIFTTLCRSLNATSLREAYFSNNRIRDGISGIQIATLSDLVALDFSYNDVSYDNLNTFISALNDSTSVKVINFRGNFKAEQRNSVRRGIECDYLEQWKLKTFSDGKAPALLGAYG